MALAIRAPSVRGLRRSPAPDADSRFAVHLTSGVLEQQTFSAVNAPCTPRFTINATGDIGIVGNTLMTAPASDPSAVDAQNGVGSKMNDNDFTMAFFGGYASA